MNTPRAVEPDAVGCYQGEDPATRNACAAALPVGVTRRGTRPRETRVPCTRPKEATREKYVSAHE